MIGFQKSTSLEICQSEESINRKQGRIQELSEGGARFILEQKSRIKKQKDTLQANTWTKDIFPVLR